MASISSEVDVQWQKQLSEPLVTVNVLRYKLECTKDQQ